MGSSFPILNVCFGECEMDPSYLAIGFLYRIRVGVRVRILVYI